MLRQAHSWETQFSFPELLLIQDTSSSLSLKVGFVSWSEGSLNIICIIPSSLTGTSPNKILAHLTLSWQKK